MQPDEPMKPQDNQQPADPSDHVARQSAISPDAEPSTGTVSVAHGAPAAPISAPQAPTVMTPAAPYQPVPVMNKPKKRWVLPLIIGLASLFVLAIAAVVAAYFLWYQKPEKVVSDAIFGFATQESYGSKTNITMTQPGHEDTNNISIAIDQKSTRSIASIDYKVSGSISSQSIGPFDGSVVATQDSDIYLKLNNLKSLLTDTFKVKTADLPASVTKLLDRVDGKWIMITADDLSTKGSVDTKKIQQCVSDVSNKAVKDKSYMDELRRAYVDNMFIVIVKELGTKDGNLGYEIKIDSQKFVSFVKAAASTRYAKETIACYPDSEQKTINDGINNIKASDIDKQVQDAKASTTITVWASQWTHSLKAVDVTTTSSSLNMKVAMTTQQVNAADVKKPTDAVALKDIKGDIQNAYSDLFSSSLTYYDSPSLDVDSLTNATIVMKKAEAYNALYGRYPSNASEFETAGDPSTSVKDSDISLVDGVPLSSSEIGYRKCAVGVQVMYMNASYQIVTYGLGGAPSGQTLTNCADTSR